MNVQHLLRKKPRKSVLHMELWTKTAKHTTVGECSHEMTMLLGALLGTTINPSAEQASAMRRCYKALTSQAMPKEDDDA